MGVGTDHDSGVATTYTTYNPLSLLQPGRIDDIITEFRDDAVIGLPGTKIRRGRLWQDEFIVRRWAEYDVYHWGWDNVTFSNRSAGVCLAVNRRVFPRATRRQICSPLVSIRGRAGAIRYRVKCRDVLLISMYLPPETSASSKMASDKVARWVERLVISVGARVEVILLADANAHLGRHRYMEGDVWVNSDDPAVGGHDRECENYNGELLHKLMIRNPWIHDLRVSQPVG